MAKKQIEKKEDKTRYIVFCHKCGSTWIPTHGNPLWWMAKHHADKGYLDAACVSGEKCGCVQRLSKPDAPFRVFGYNRFFEVFDIPCTTFVEAVKNFLRISSGGNVVYISGVSSRVQHRLEYRV
jgi:hypothetical protein